MAWQLKAPAIHWPIKLSLFHTINNSSLKWEYAKEYMSDTKFKYMQWVSLYLMGYYNFTAFKKYSLEEKF